MDLNSKIIGLKGVGKKRAELYGKLNILSLKDLLEYFPKKYLDCSISKSLDCFEVGQNCCVKARVVEKFKIALKLKLKFVLKVTACDEGGNFFEVIFFNNNYFFESLKKGCSYIFYGKLEEEIFKKKIVSPKVFNLNEAGIFPIYGLTKGLSSKIISADIKKIFSLNFSIEESLPDYILKKHNLLGLYESFLNIHFPKNMQVLKKARRRFVFEELLIWQLKLAFFKKKLPTSSVLQTNDIAEFLSSLNFKLTKAQLCVLQQCISDCSKKFSMNRLIQGDVGCGKTIVAAALAYLFFKSKLQVAVVVPTEILARQHCESFLKLFKPFKTKVELLVGSLPLKCKRDVAYGLKTGKIDIVIGTHAVFQDSVDFLNLGLVVIDEQHRFGVSQKDQIIRKGKMPHKLFLSATPIPRTLALMVYGEFDISVIDELPAGRLLVKTFVISSNKRTRALLYIKDQVKLGRQAYIVCPLIEASDKNIVSVSEYVKNLKENELSGVRVFEIHGKMSFAAKEEAMNKFLNKEIDVLIATTVIEVGVNVENATVIMVENAELFGLAQLHQLRGRVGRSCFQSICILVSDSKSIVSRKRLHAICRSCNGFEISKNDLNMRGPGDFFGERQHGFLKFKLANLIKDFDLFKFCNMEAKLILHDDEKLEKEDNSKLKLAVKKLECYENIIL